MATNAVSRENRGAAMFKAHSNMSYVRTLTVSKCLKIPDTDFPRTASQSEGTYVLVGDDLRQGTLNHPFDLFPIQ